MDFLDLILLFFSALLVRHLLNGAIFVPTDRKSVQTIIRLSGARAGLKAVDLGSGDGRIVIAIAQTGAWSVGIESNPLLYIWSRIKIERLGLARLAKIELTSFWPRDLSEFNIVVVFGMTHIMGRLQRKLEQELRPGTLVISNIYKFSDWEPVALEGGIRVYRVGK